MTERPQQGKHGATYDDLLRAPADKIAEILDGKLVLTPIPPLECSYVTGCIIGDLGPLHSRELGWRFILRVEFHLRDDIVVPDLAGWRRTRMPQSPKGAFCTVAPDWVCEVISPATAACDRTVKMEIYKREQVGHVWLIDPALRIIESYRLREGQWIRAQAAHGNLSVHLEPFAEIELDLSSWWGELP
ncbi:MAG TPA: Uma2 family endonuclease [Myxococcales bacterium]|nr:Uma2 family endonuclease [Myxococcales bacterium]